MIRHFSIWLVAIIFAADPTLACAPVDSPLRALQVSHVDYEPVVAEESSQTDLRVPVSIAQIDANTLLVANYSQIILVDLAEGKFWPLRQPPNVKWVPTGLAYDAETKQIFLANYLGFPRQLSWK